jgi:hypothetical protein
MTNRREFLQTGVAVSALSLAIDSLPAAAASASTADARRVAPYKAIFDPRYSEGRTFAQAAGALGIPIRAIEEGDVTDYWYDELDLLWRQGPVAIAGLTQFGPMFVLEQMANERGMRVVLRIEHQARPNGTFAHVMSAPAETVALAARLIEQGTHWPSAMAAAAARCPANLSAKLTHTIVTTVPAPELERVSDVVPERVIHYYATDALQRGHGVPFDGPLFTWVIAERARVAATHGDSTHHSRGS